MVRATKVEASAEISVWSTQADLLAPHSSSYWTAIISPFRTAFGWFLHKINPVNYWNKRNVYNLTFIPGREDYNVPGGLDQLYHLRGRYYSDRAILPFFEALKAQHPNFDYTERGMPKDNETDKRPFDIVTKINIKAAEQFQNPTTKLFAIPFNNNKHIVVIFIDKDRKTVEYYDPRGATSNASESKRYSELDLRANLVQIRDHFFGAEGRIVENLRQHQNCRHRCGIWVSHYIFQRVMGQTAPQISSMDISNDQLEAFQVNTMAHTIQNYYFNP